MAEDVGNDRRLARFVPAIGWLSRYERRWLRGDLTAGIAVTALVVPKNLGYAGIAGVPLQNGLYAAAAGRDHLRAVLHVAANLDRAELVACGRRWRRGARNELGGKEAAQLVAAITLATGRAVPAARGISHGLDRAVSVQGGRDRVPGGRGGRRRHRRAAEADGNLLRGRQRVARVRHLGVIAGRHSLRRRCSSR